MEYEQTSYLRTVFNIGQSSVAVVALLFVGYIAGGTRIFAHDTAIGLRRLATTICLPALVFSVVGSETSAKHIFSYWPLLAFTLVTHVLSLIVSYSIFYRLFGMPHWIVETLSFNNLTSFPLLILAGLARTPGILSHLVSSETEQDAEMLKRAANYVLLYAVVSEVARRIISPLLPKAKPAIYLPISTDADLEDEEEAVAPTSHAAPPPTETAPLLPNAHSVYPPVAAEEEKRDWISHLSPFIISFLLTLPVILIPGVQSAIFGHRGGELGTGARVNGWVGATLGTVVGWLGGIYAVVELLSSGGGMKKTDGVLKKHVQTLGNVLAIIFWRFAAIPALTVTALHFANKLSPSFWNADPILSFTLALLSLTPPLLPLAALPIPTQLALTLTNLHLFTPFLIPFPLAAALAVTGNGISFESQVDWKKTLKSAAGGGIAGALAMILQVLTLMPLRTIMNYQYRNGGSIKGSFNHLRSTGGFPRFYAGLPAALFQGPLSRFGDTAANAGIIALLETVQLPVLVKTIGASILSATFRMLLTPIDALKTTQQTEGGRAGLRLLRARIADKGVGSLWYGALATAAATFVGHYPWFATYNYLQEILPIAHNLLQKLLRQAVIGFSASVVSDTSSNSLRVLKTYRQTHAGDIGYLQSAKEIVETDGVRGLFGRGLATRILTNGLQGLLFSILWKLISDAIAGKA